MNIQTYDSKYEYLESKLKIDECVDYCTEYSNILKKTIMCGKCFWKSVTLPYDFIPECSTCKKDMDNFKNKFNGIMRLSVPHDTAGLSCVQALLIPGEVSATLTMQIECGKNCLWYDWFDNKRQIQAKQSNVRLVYSKKEDKMNDNKNKKELQDKENTINKENKKNNNNNKHNNKHNKSNKHNR